MSNSKKQAQPPDDHKEITIDTLRSPPFQIQPAPISARVVAGIIDSALVGIIWSGLTYASGLGPLPYSSTGAGFLAGITFLYYFLQEGSVSSTIGKRLSGLRVVGRLGDPLSVRESLIRNLVRLVDWLPAFYILGVASIARSRERRRLGDLLAGTVVTPAQAKDPNPPPAPFLFH